MSTTTTETSQPKALKHSQLPGGFPFMVAAGAVAVFLVLNLAVGIGLVGSVLLAWVVLLVGVYAITRAVEGGRFAVDNLMTVLIASAFALALLPLVSVLWKVAAEGIPHLTSAFFRNSMEGVYDGGPIAGGAYHAIIGTILITAGAAVISIPIGIFTAIYLVEYAGRGGWFATTIRFLVDVMTGIPSIVAGLFAYSLFLIIAGPRYTSGLMGSVALSVLMIPIVVRSTEEMLKLVPNELRESSYALGVPKWRTIAKVVLPTSLAGILTGVTLSVARVIGETAPLLLVTGDPDGLNFNLFSGQMATLPVFVYSEIGSSTMQASDPSFQRAWAAALTLMLIVMVLNLVARILSKVFSPKGEK